MGESHAAAACGATAPIRELLHLRPGVTSVKDSDGMRHLVCGLDHEPLGRISAAQYDLLRRLATAPMPADRPRPLPEEADGPGVDDPECRALLQRLRTRGWLVVTVCAGEQRLYTIETTAIADRRPPPVADSPPRLSRFTVLRRDGTDMVAHSPRGRARLTFTEPALLRHLADLEHGDGDAGDGDGTALRLRLDLENAGLLADPREESDLAGAQWSAHDLWFHTNTRWIVHPGLRMGRSDWAQDRFAPVPARPAPYPGPAVDLFVPDLERLLTEDRTLTSVIERRRSSADHDDARPIGLRSLGEFLYRSARTLQSDIVDGVEHVHRPSITGGSGGGDLELYPVVRHVQGLDAGLYHYDPAGHRLVRVSEYSAPVRRLVRAAAWATAGADGEPQVLFVIAARFGRIMWRYENLCYALILKNLGALYQTMHNVATAMGLASRALGVGDTAQFERVTGRDPLVEGSVGEFVLGTHPPTKGVRG